MGAGKWESNSMKDAFFLASLSISPTDKAFKIEFL